MAFRSGIRAANITQQESKRLHRAAEGTAEADSKRTALIIAAAWLPVRLGPSPALCTPHIGSRVDTALAANH